MTGTNNVPTTFEMDGLFTQKDIDNRNRVVYQCRNCRKWTVHEHESLKTNHVPCSECGQINYDDSSIKSLRSYNPLTDNKRKVK